MQNLPSLHDKYTETRKASIFFAICNDPLVSAHPTPLMRGVLGVPRSPETDVAVLVKSERTHFQAAVANSISLGDW